MARTTWRWYRTWQEWELQRWTTPDPHEYLLARIAQRVQQVLHKNPNNVTVAQQFIPWKLREEIAVDPEARKEAIKNSKAIWVGMLESAGGMKIVRKTRPRKLIDGN